MHSASEDDYPGVEILSQQRGKGGIPLPAYLVISQAPDSIQDLLSWSELPQFGYFNKNDPEPAMVTCFFEHMVFRRKIINLPWHSLLNDYVGVETVKQVIKFVEKIKDDPAGQRLPVVILGESGTGKEQVARLIHAVDRLESKVKINNLFIGTETEKDQQANQYTGRFVPVLMASIGSGVFEGELFGIDELQDAAPVAGYVREAEKGSLFIDELSDISMDIQGKLLRFLQEQQVRPIGGKWQTIEDVRVIFATNRDPVELIKSNEFREDFLHRIDGLTIRLKSLKDRTTEHRLLVEHLFVRALPKHQDSQLLDWVNADVISHLVKMCQQGIFTGNVRQLARFIERIVRMGREPIDMQCFDLANDYSLIQPIDTLISNNKFSIATRPDED